MRLIDADALKEAINEHTDYKGYLVCDTEEIIDLAPTIEERPHGEWIKEFLQIDERHFRSFAKCKVCGCEFKPYSFAVKEFDFCPKCGSDNRKTRGG